MKVPEYRVRLFLSVDLTGSTAFKHKQQNTIKWIKAFQNFYGEFPNLLRSEYSKVCKDGRQLAEYERENGYPRLWKTVGDEILFCCCLRSASHLGACIDSFIESLKKYGETAKAYDLNTKGNAWVSSFPTPNCSIKPIDPSSDGDEPDSLNGKTPLPTEENELTIDEYPSKFDFLGKGIDAGFRISKNSAVNALTISPGLGILLCQTAASFRITKFNRKMHLTEMQTFKGVANNNPYPVLTIDTCRENDYEDLLDMQRHLLGKPNNAPIDKLEPYLNAYLKYHGIEIPKIKDTYNDETFSPPAFYEEYKREWEKELAQIQQQDRLIEDSSEKDNVPVDELDTVDSRKKELVRNLEMLKASPKLFR